MESGWFCERILLCLGTERADVVVVVEQEGKQDAHRQGDEDPFDFQVPEID